MHIGKQLKVIIVEPEKIDRTDHEQVIASEVDDNVTVDISELSIEPTGVTSVDRKNRELIYER